MPRPPRPHPVDATVTPDHRPRFARERALGDFSATPRLLTIAAIAAPVGALVAIFALGLLDLVGLISNLLYSGRIDTSIGEPDVHVLGVLSVLVPVVGGLTVGLMARFGSERVRGHGIPEAIETILLNGSRMEPRLAVLKPLSSAVSIGTGGPFGAEGPIIVTGGAIGSIAGQLLRLTAAERRSLLVAGAAAGMAAVFGTPVAAVLLAVELLLFEWRPRSLVPVVVGVVAAQVVRTALAHAGLLTPAPLFPIPLHPDMANGSVLAGLIVGLGGGTLAWVMTRTVYAAEDAFHRLPLHWMWWPAIGGVVVGIGGLIDPRTLGVGYGVIHSELTGHLAVSALVSILVVKLVIWSVALGSSTSGGILAPLLMLGAAIGALLGHAIPGGDPSTWAVLGMAAALAGVMRSPFTSIVFALELTHAIGLLFPLLVACVVAYGMTVLVLPRSILTEKIARRGYHVNREYEVDPLQALFVREVMTTDVLSVDPTTPTDELLALLPEGAPARRQRLYPILTEDRALTGVVTLSDLRGVRDQSPAPRAAELSRSPVVAHPDETLRQVANRMITTGHGVLPVLDEGDPPRMVGLVTQFDLLRAHERQLFEERRRERPLTLRGLSRA